MMTVRRVAFIGAVGIPNRYGGFESFLDACAPVFAQDRETIVTCEARRYDDRAPFWHGVERIFVGIAANGVASIAHDAVAFFRVVRRVDAIIVLGVSAGVFMPLFRVVCSMLGKRLVVNVDGLEWRRAKFTRARRAFLWVSDRLSQACAHAVIVDSAPLAPFLTRSGRAKAAFIGYSGDQVQHVAPRDRGYCLTICRIEPENNCHLLLAAFAASGASDYRFVGNWSASAYGRDLLARYRTVPGLQMLDPIYEPLEVAALREGAAIYLHGHSVGGTNPSLVEILFYDARILAFDCAFNRATAAGAAEYFATCEELSALIDADGPVDDGTRARIRHSLTRAEIVALYSAVIDG